MPVVSEGPTKKEYLSPSLTSVRYTRKTSARLSSLETQAKLQRHQVKGIMSSTKAPTSILFK